MNNILVGLFKVLFFYCLVLSHAAMAAQPEANCDLYFLSVEDFDWGIAEGGYDPLEPNGHIDAGTIMVSNRGPDSCRYHITGTVGRRGDSSFARGAYHADGDMIEYFLLTKPNLQTSNYLKDYPFVSNRSMVLEGSKVGEEDQVSSTVFMAVETLQFVQEGVYSDSVTLRLFEGRYNRWNYSPKLHDTAVLNIRIPVLTVMSINLAESGNGNMYTLDVGEIISGASHRVDMGIMSNAYFQVMISSENRGKLRQVDGSGEVPYMLMARGVLVDLDSSGDILAPSESPGLNLPFPLDITLNPDGLLAPDGTYRDKIHIEVKSL